MGERLQEGLQWVKQSPQIAFNWGNLQFQRLKNQAGEWGVKGRTLFQTSQHKAERATQWISSQFASLLKGFRNSVVEPVSDFCRRNMAPLLNNLQKACKDKLQRTKEFFHHWHQRALTSLQEKHKKIKRLSQEHLFDYILKKKLPFRLHEFLKKWLAHPTIKAICGIMVQIYAILAGGIIALSIQILQLISKGAEAIGRIYRVTKGYCALGIKKISGMLKLGYEITRKTIFYTIYYTLLGLTIGSILFLWGIRSLGTLMASLTANVPQIKRFFPSNFSNKE